VRQILAIARREACAFGRSTQAPVIAAAFLVLTGLFYYLLVLGYADTSLAMTQSLRPRYLNLHAGIFHKLYGYVVLFLIFLMPAVTMRLVSGEYRSGRYDLIASWPVPERHWILGKWVSAVAVAAALLAGTAFYFGLTLVLGLRADPPVAPDWQPMATALLGLLLLAGAIAAWGLCASALLSHQGGAYFLAFAANLALFLVGQLAPFLPGALAGIAAQLALGDHFLRFAAGVLDSRDLVYFAGLGAVGLAAATAALAQRRLPPGRRVRPWLGVLVVLAVAVFLQAVAVRRPVRVDITPDRLYSLAPQTERILDVLDRERPDPAGGGTRPAPTVTVLAFYQNLDGARQSIQALLQSFADQSPRFRFEVVDPDNNPDLVREHGVTVARTVIVICEDRRWQLLEPDEGQLASAVYRLATDTRPVVYWLLGHGEARPDLDESGGASQLAGLLGDAGYEVRPLVLPERRRLPDDAAVIVWAGPKVDPSPETVALLDRYLESGGAMACFFGPDTPPRLRDWTATFGIRQKNDVVVARDRASALAGVGLRTVTVVEYGTHPAVARLQAVATTFPLVQTFRLIPEAAQRATGEYLLLTGPDTWAETDSLTRYSGEPSFDPPADRAGPLPFGVALELAPAPGDSLATGRLVLVGSSGFVSNANVSLYGNRDLALNLLGWLAQEEELLDIRGRRASFQPLLLDGRTKDRLGWLSVLVWPGLVGAVWSGFVFWYGRRH